MHKLYYIFCRLFLSNNQVAKKLGVKIGANVRLFSINFGSEPFLIEIGNNVTVTTGVRFITHDGAGDLMKDENGRRYYYNNIKIGNNVFVGVNSIIMPGVKIDDNVIVAAGSVVTKSVPENSIVAGVPAKIIGDFNNLKFKMINTYKSDKDIDISLSYIERIMAIKETSYKPYL